MATFLRNTWRWITGRDKLEKEIKELKDELERTIREAPLHVPWILKEYRFSEETKRSFLNAILSEAPNAGRNINLVVIGAVKAGKSSLVNTMKTVFREADEIATIAYTGDDDASVTKKFHKVILKTLENGHKIIIHDTKGIHAKREILLADIEDVIAGHVPNNYEFKDTPISHTRGTRNPQYVEKPTLDQLMHGVLIVVDMNNVGKSGNIEETMRMPLKKVKDYLKSNHIPFRIILTKLDELPSPPNTDMKYIITSKQALKQYELAKSDFCLKDTYVLPVINYTGGHERDIVRDVFALYAMKSILLEAICYIENYAKGKQ